MSESGDGTGLRATLHKRHDVLAALASAPRTKPDLVDALDASRSTIDRAISALKDADCVERRGSTYHPTTVGRITLAEYDRYKTTMDGIAAADAVLNALPETARIEPEFLNGVTVQTADPHAPESALRDSIEALTATDRLVGLAPVVLSLYTDVLTDLVHEHGLQAELLLHESTLDSLLEYYKDRLSRADITDHVDIYVTDQNLPYALWIMEHDEHPRAGITVHENGGVRGVLMNDSPAAVRWARNEYARYLEAAEPASIDVSP